MFFPTPANSRRSCREGRLASICRGLPCRKSFTGRAAPLTCTGSASFIIRKKSLVIGANCVMLSLRLLLLFVSPLGKKAVARSHLRPFFLRGQPPCGGPGEA